MASEMSFASFGILKDVPLHKRVQHIVYKFSHICISICHDGI